MQTVQVKVRATGPPQDRFPPSLLWAGRTLPTCPRGPRKSWIGFSERILREERGGARRKTRAGSTREPDGAAPRPLPESRVPSASGLPVWVRRTGRAGVGSARGWQPGRAASAAGRGSRVRRGESLRSGARAASWEFSARRGRRELGLPGEPGTRRGPGPRRRGRRREWEGRRQRRTQRAEEAARGEAEPGQGPERSDQVPQPRGRSGARTQRRGSCGRREVTTEPGDPRTEQREGRGAVDSSGRRGALGPGTLRPEPRHHDAATRAAPSS